MAAIDALRKQWREEARFRPFRPYLHIDEEGLSLGAGTLIARMAANHERPPALVLDGEEARILATLSLGYRQPIPITALKFIKRASMQWGRGEKALAHFELAYARLPRFETRDETKSLFYADGFLRLGASPHALMLARGLDTSQLDLLKYSPDQPRVPAGYHRESGRWTSSDGKSGMETRGYTHLAEEDSEEKRREDEKDLPETERRALREAPRKEDVEEGRGIPLQLPLVEEGDPIGIGRYAGESIPARSPSRNFTVKERQEINRIGRETGCHSCGTKDPGTPKGNFILDHQPPSALNFSGVPQRLYPHCVNCSRTQGSAIWRKLSGEPQ